MNIHFDNFNTADLVSKKAKDRLKKYIKTKLIDPNDTILDQLKENTSYFITNFFKEDEKYILDLNYLIKEHNIHISLIKKSKIEESRLKNKKKLKARIEQIRSKRFQARNRKMYLNNENNIRKLLNADGRITTEMINAYYLAQNKFGNELPNPHDILNDKEEHIKKFIEYISLVMKNTSSEDNLMQLLDNEYSNYISTVTGFDYKKIIEMFKNNTEKEKQDNKLAPVYEELNDNECTHECCNHDKVIDITEEATEHHENFDLENQEINSTDV